MSHDKVDDQPVDGAKRHEVPVRPLRGYATLIGDPDEFLPRLRAEQAELARKKMAEIFNDTAPSDV
jgi:hypothetical protein